MSVNPSLLHLTVDSLIPRRLRALHPNLAGGTAPDEWRVWALGSGEFSNGSVNVDLALRVDHETHGLVEPATITQLAHYVGSLTATQSDWELCETIPPESRSTADDE